ncbi:hypothetical protein [Halorhodospira halochloris]|uniref:hypothetical protein n=1 Tax=Halorhodospira halochloris TaxID=1052 RepID=UPI0013A58924|nr:hypothetical protein [Halorhodospira halochloris]
MRQALVIGCVITACKVGDAIADPLISYPGTKATSMGGAFTAAPGNVSSLLYNPAAMVRPDFVWEDAEGEIQTQQQVVSSLEYSQSVQAAAGPTGDKVDNYMLGMAALTPTLSYGFMYSPIWEVSHGDENAQELDAYMVGFGWDISDRAEHGEGLFISLGASAGYLESSADWREDEEDDYSDEEFFGVAGLKARIVDTRTFSFDLGGSYRSEATFDEAEVFDVDGSMDSPVSKQPWGLPEEVSYGAAMHYQGTGYLVSLTASHRETGYEAVTTEYDDMETNSVGLELGLAGGSLSFRSGYYSSTSDAIDSDGATLGIGFNAIREHGELSLELAFEARENTIAGGEDYDEVLSSISMNWVRSP